ncbi:MAG: hypothetical protein AAGH71_03535 [Planctomycetota bacterium]
MLTTSTIAVSMGLLAIHSVSAQRIVAFRSNDATRARMFAESAIQLALYEIENRFEWRTAESVDPFGVLTYEGVTFSATIEDPDDGDLTSGEDQRARIIGDASVGQARQRLSVLLESDTRAVEALEYPIVIAGGADGIGELCGYTRGSFLPFCAGGFLQVPIDWMYSAASMFWIDLPDPSVVQEYAAIGTLVPVGLSDKQQGKKYKNLELTSSGVSAGIESNLRHIYVIDGGGQHVELEETALIGTLVVINARSFTFFHPIVARPGPEGLPLILADCDVIIKHAQHRLDTSWRDLDDLDTGPDFDQEGFEGLQGIIYVDGDLEIDEELQMRGSLIVTGSADINDKAVIRFEEAYSESPPPGFRVDEGLMIVEGTYREVIDD